MFEHMKNYELLLQRIGRGLKADESNTANKKANQSSQERAAAELKFSEKSKLIKEYISGGSNPAEGDEGATVSGANNPEAAGAENVGESDAPKPTTPTRLATGHTMRRRSPFPSPGPAAAKSAFLSPDIAVPSSPTVTSSQTPTPSTANGNMTTTSVGTPSRNRHKASPKLASPGIRYKEPPRYNFGPGKLFVT
jgi:hypothetical protein